MNYREKQKAITYLKKCKKKLKGIKFTYKNVHLLIQMIFKVKDLMEDSDDDLSTNTALNQVTQSFNKEMLELIEAKQPAVIKEKFDTACRMFDSDLNHCLMHFGVDPFNI